MSRPARLFSDRSDRSSISLLVAAGLCWGTGGVTGYALSDVAHLSALAVATYRLLLGGGLLVLVLSLAGSWPTSAAAWRRIGAVAALAATFQACFFAAVMLSSVPLATLTTIGIAPILVVVTTSVTSRRLPRWPVVRPVVIGLAGLALLVGTPGGQSLAATLAGAALSAISGAGFAALTLLGRRPVPGLTDATSTGFGFALGGVVLAAITVASAGTVDVLAVAPSGAALGLLLFMATVPTAVAYSLYFRGLRHSTATTATVVALLEPLTGTILAAVLLGQTLSVAALLGAVLLSVSILDTGRSHLRQGSAEMDAPTTG